MNIRVLSNNVAVTRIKAENKTTSGIVLTQSDAPDKAKVVSVGPDVENLAVDDVLLINWNKATKAEDDLYVLSDEDVIWVYED